MCSYLSAAGISDQIVKTAGCASQVNNRQTIAMQEELRGAIYAQEDNGIVVNFPPAQGDEGAQECVISMPPDGCMSPCTCTCVRGDDLRKKDQQDEPLPAKESSRIVTVTRPVYTQEELDQSFSLEHNPEDIKTKLKRYTAENCQCNGKCVLSAVLSFFPFIAMFRSYQWRQWLPSDIIAGLCVGVVHIPQGMGFALLTSLPPATGLYTSFFPPLIYFFFGTSNHLSMGTMALMSLMAGTVIDREVAKMDFEHPMRNGTTNLTDEPEFVQAKIGIAVSLTLMIGLFQLLMGVFRVGIIATFMSMTFISSFLTGSAVVIIISQLPGLLCLTLPRHSGMFSTPLRLYEVFKHITKSNVSALLTGCICVTVLIVFKEVISDRFRKKVKIPFPTELLVVVIATLVSHFAAFEKQYNVRVVTDIKQGFPTPALPPMINFENYIVDAFVIALISFTISIAMAKMMARKHCYAINTNQEILAYGIMHSVSSFFSCFPAAQAPPRTLVHDGAGGKTQLHALVSCLLVLLVMLAVGNLFYSLPITALSAIIICALIPLLFQFKEIPFLWRMNKWDLAVWLITFLSTVVLDITMGLAIGIGFSALSLVLQIHLTNGTLLHQLKDTEYFIPEKLAASAPSEQTLDAPGVKTFRFEAPLMYLNIDSFRNQLYAKTINPGQRRWVEEDEVKMPTLPRIQNILKKSKSFDTLITLKQKMQTSVSSPKRRSLIETQIESFRAKRLSTCNPEALMHLKNKMKNSNGFSKLGGQNKTHTEKPSDVKTMPNGIRSGDNSQQKETVSVVPLPPPIHTIIMDCSCITLIDSMGLNTLKSLSADYANAKIRFLLADCSRYLHQKLNATGMLSSFKVFPSVLDALIWTNDQQEKTAETDC